MSIRTSSLTLASGIAITVLTAAASANEKPLMRDFMGLNGHTVLFDSAKYAPVASHVRDYHNLSWDVGDDPANDTQFPRAAIGYNWNNIYGPWKQNGFHTLAAVQMGGFTDASWVGKTGEAEKYGRAFAQHFGPTHGNGLVESVQIGNEPGFLSDATYKAIFRNMAQGIRAVDPALPIVTSNTRVGPSGQYHKSLSIFEDPEMTPLFDVISINTYAQLEGWPTWRRSYPEDPRLTQQAEILATIAWRDEHAPGKQIWITEFGYDSTTQPNHTSGTWKDWVGVTDTQQAQYITRSFLTFSKLDVDRAYMFWFDDKDSPSNHGSSGLTRNGVPKPSYWAMAHLNQTLGDYRFDEVVVERAGDVHVYQYEHGDDPDALIWAIWSPTGEGRQVLMTLDDLPGKPLWADLMPLESGPADKVTFTQLPDGRIQLLVGESPIYLRIAVPEPSMALFVLAPLALLRRRGR